MAVNSASENEGINGLFIQLGPNSDDVYPLPEIGNYLSETGVFVPIEGQLAQSILNYLPSQRSGVRCVIEGKSAIGLHNFDFGGTVYQVEDTDSKHPRVYIGPDYHQRTTI